MQIVKDYRRLHTVPEPDNRLYKTVGYVKKVLSGTGCQVFTPVPGAVCAFFSFGKRQTLAFRADMDGLPIGEKTGLPWQSRHPGMMHACGHDGHTAILLELARRLAKRKTARYNILLIFQPAEETGGGATRICRTGVLKTYGAVCIFGLHLWPGLEKGQLYSRPGVMMSRAQAVRACIYGKSAHIAGSDPGGDSLRACVDFYRRAEGIKEKAPFLLKFGRLEAGGAGNVISGQGVMEGSLRSFCESVQESLRRRLQREFAHCLRQHACRGRLQFSPGYPAVCNHGGLWQYIAAHYPVKRLEEPLWTTEDFSCYQREIPGIYFLLGVGDTPPLHSDKFAFDEKVLLKGADFFTGLAGIGEGIIPSCIEKVQKIPAVRLNTVGDLPNSSARDLRRERLPAFSVRRRPDS